MESVEGEEMVVPTDVVVIPIRDGSEETKLVCPYSTKDVVTLIKIAKHKKEGREQKWKVVLLWWVWCVKEHSEKVKWSSKKPYTTRLQIAQDVIKLSLL